MRDPALLKGCDVLVDVGEEYNPLAHRYHLVKSVSLIKLFRRALIIIIIGDGI